MKPKGLNPPCGGTSSPPPTQPLPPGRPHPSPPRVTNLLKNFSQPKPEGPGHGGPGVGGPRDDEAERELPLLDDLLVEQHLLLHPELVELVLGRKVDVPCHRLARQDLLWDRGQGSPPPCVSPSGDPAFPPGGSSWNVCEATVKKGCFFLRIFQFVSAGCKCQ